MSEPAPEGHFVRPWYLRTASAYRGVKRVYEVGTSLPVVRTFARLGEKVAEGVLSHAPYIDRLPDATDAATGEPAATFPAFRRIDAGINKALQYIDQKVDSRIEEQETWEGQLVRKVAKVGNGVAGYVPLGGDAIKRIIKDLDPDQWKHKLLMPPPSTTEAPKEEEETKAPELKPAVVEEEEEAQKPVSAPKAEVDDEDEVVMAKPTAAEEAEEKTQQPPEAEDEGKDDVQELAAAAKAAAEEVSASATLESTEPTNAAAAPAKGKRGGFFRTLKSFGRTKRKTHNYPKTPTNELPPAAAAQAPQQLTGDPDASEEEEGEEGDVDAKGAVTPEGREFTRESSSGSIASGEPGSPAAAGVSSAHSTPTRRFLQRLTPQKSRSLTPSRFF